MNCDKVFIVKGPKGDIGPQGRQSGNSLDYKSTYDIKHSNRVL